MQPNQNPFNAPAPVGGVRPRVADIAGRMVAFTPTALALNVPGIKAGTFQDRITTDVVVLDGGPLAFGGKPEKGIPHTLVISTPCEFTGMYVSQTNMVGALRGSVGAGVVLGRIVQGTTNVAGNNPPWNLAPIDPADPAYRMALDYWSARALGQIVKPEPQPIAGAPAPTLAYTHGTTMPHNAQTGQPVASPAVVGAYATAQPTNVAPTPTVDPNAAFAAWQASQAQAAPMVAVSASPVPPGVNMPQAVWDSLADAQRQQIAASVGHALPPVAVPAGAQPNPY